MGGLDGPPKPPDARQRPGKAVALLDSRGQIQLDASGARALDE